MGSGGKKKKNVFESAADNVSYAIDDTAKAISEGKPVEAVGYTQNILTGGATETLFPSEGKQRVAEAEAQAQEVTDQLEAVRVEKENRINKIKTRLEAEIRQRRKTPGRSQIAPILTSTLVPPEATSGKSSILSGR